MTNKDPSKYPYDRSEYVVLPPIRKAEDGTLTTEPQNVDSIPDGNFYDIKIEDCPERVYFDSFGNAHYAGTWVQEKCSKWRLGYVREDIYEQAVSRQPTPPPIDVESLKREVCEKYACDIEVETAEVRGIIRMLIDHLASAGYLRAPLPRIEGLKEAIEWQDGKYGFYEYNDAFGHFPQVATDEAARAQLKLQGGDQMGQRMPFIKDIGEANRIISVLEDEVQSHFSGKRFWMWAFILSSPFQAIFGEFLRGFWKGIFE